MPRVPIVDFTLGNRTLDDLNVRHLLQYAEFEEAIGKFDSVVLSFKDGPELAQAWDLARHGNVLQLSMGYYNDIVLPMCLTFLSSIEPNFEDQTVQIHFSGYLRAMDVGEKDRSLNGRTIREVVEEIVADYEPLVVGTIEQGDTKISSTNTQSKQSDLSFLEGIASSFGMKWKIEPTDKTGQWALSLYRLEYDKTKAQQHLPIHAYPEKEFLSDEKSLKLRRFRPKSNIFGVSSRVEIRSNNPDRPVVVDTDPKDPTKEPRVVYGSDVVAVVFGEVVRVHFYENVTDEDAARIIGEQTLQMDELAFVTATNAQMQEGHPELRVGEVRRIVPHGISLFEKVFVGDYMITASRHRVDSKTGYDTWISVAMNSLTLPEPPEEVGWGGGGGGSGGPPVLIRLYYDGRMEGWYMNVGANNQVTRGTYITEEEIKANSYWMSHINPVAHGSGVGIGVGPLWSPQFVEAQGVVDEDDIMQPETLTIHHPHGPGVPLASGWTNISIDWPENWRTYGDTVMATPIRTRTNADFFEQLPGFEGWGPRQAYVAEEPEETNWVQRTLQEATSRRMGTGRYGQ